MACSWKLEVATFMRGKEIEEGKGGSVGRKIPRETEDD